MYDALGVFLPEAEIDVNRLRAVRGTPGGQGIRGQLGNLRVTQTREGVFLKGSIPKYLQGDNARDLTRAGLRDALRKVEVDLGLPLDRGRVYTLELARSIPVEAAPADYMTGWGTLPRFVKDTYSNKGGVVYRNRTRSFTGYDKTAEAAPNPLPVPLEGGYALRLELRVKKGVKRQFGQPLTPWELVEPEHYRQAHTLWARFYDRIPKHKDIVLTGGKMTPKDLERTLAAAGLQSLGYDRADEYVRSRLAAGAIDKTTAARMRQLIKGLAKDPGLTCNDTLTRELDSKVRAVVRFAR